MCLPYAVYQPGLQTRGVQKRIWPRASSQGTRSVKGETGVKTDRSNGVACVFTVVVEVL